MNNKPGKFDLQEPWVSYLLGLAHTDGHMRYTRMRLDGSGGGGYLSISLRRRDEDILLRLAELIPFNTSISRQTSHTSFKTGQEYDHKSTSIRVFDANFRKQFFAWGMPYGPKSKTIKPPDVGTYIERDYIRGLFDGDGSLGIGKPKGRFLHGCPYIGFITISELMKDYIVGYLDRITGTTRTCSRNKRDNAYNICAWNEDAVEVAKDLYYDGCLAITHKLNVAAGIASWTRPSDMKSAYRRRDFTEAEDALVCSGTTSEVAKILGRGFGVIARRQTLLGIRQSKLVGPRGIMAMAYGKELAIDVAARAGISVGTLRDRLKAGWSMDDAVSKPTNQIRQDLMIDGKTGASVAAQHGIGLTTYWTRIRLGWSLTDATTISVGKSRTDLCDLVSGTETTAQPQEETIQ